MTSPRQTNNWLIHLPLKKLRIFIFQKKVSTYTHNKLTYYFQKYVDMIIQIESTEVEIKYLSMSLLALILLFSNIKVNNMPCCIVNEVLTHFFIGRIHLLHLQIHKYFTDDSSVNFHDKVFLRFLPNFFKKWRKTLSWKFTDESSVKLLWIRKWGRRIRQLCNY